MYIRFGMKSNVFNNKIPLISLKNAIRFCFFLFLCVSSNGFLHAQKGSNFSELSIELCSSNSNANLKNNLEILDGRIYKQEIGKLISFEKNKWIKVYFTTPFVETLLRINDSLANKLNMTQSYLVKVNSFYIQENKIKGTSLKFAKFHYQADYYSKNKNNLYELVYRADSSHLIQSYLLQVSLITEIKSALNHHLIRCKNSLLKSSPIARENLLQHPKIPEHTFDVFNEVKYDGTFSTWEQLLSNKPDYAFAKLKSISKIGQLQFIDTTAKKKVSIPLFSLYAFLKQGILYKCSRFGSFQLLNIQNSYFYVGIHEQFYTPKPDVYHYRKMNKLGGLTVTSEDMESQKYLFKIDPITGKSLVICSITPADDYTSILMKLDLN